MSRKIAVALAAVAVVMLCLALGPEPSQAGIDASTTLRTEPKANGIKKKQPNFIVMLLDDHGWGDVGCNNPEVTETPHIDALAAGGIRFTDFHSGASVCTPSRAALLTGRHGLRTGVSTNFSPVSKGGIPWGEKTIADLLPSTYRKHMIGKWHLGHNAPFHPSFRGFETFYGLPYSGDMGCLDTTPQSCKPERDRSKHTPECPALCDLQNATVAIPLYDSKAPNCGATSVSDPPAADCNTNIVEQPVNEFSLNTRYRHRAEEIIAEAAKAKAKGGDDARPFFIYIGFAHTHTPMAYDEAMWGNASNRTGWSKVFGNNLAELDFAVGEINQALHTHGVAEDTLIFLTADNGPADVGTVDCDFIGTPGPYQGKWQSSPEGGGGGGVMKDTTWEGGHRIVGIASWPGSIKPGRVSHDLTSAMDLAPTLVSLAGSELPSDRSFDGMDISPLLLDETVTLPKLLAKHRLVEGTDAGARVVRPDLAAVTEEGPQRVLFHQDSGAGLHGKGSLDAVRVGKYKLFFQSHSGWGCNNIKPGKTTPWPVPLTFDVDADPAESTPVTPPDSVLQAALAAYKAKVADITSTLSHVANMDDGDKSNSACCNKKSNVCRCSGEHLSPFNAGGRVIV